MEKKLETKPFGGEIPPELSAAFEAMRMASGWVKKRMLAAAVRAFLTAPDMERSTWYSIAYRPLPPANADGLSLSEAQEAEKRLNDAKAKRRKRKDQG